MVQIPVSLAWFFVGASCFVAAFRFLALCVSPHPRKVTNTVGEDALVLVTQVLWAVVWLHYIP